MSFPQSVKEAAYTRSGGVCECKRSSHPKHSGKRCKTSVTKTGTSDFSGV